MFLTPIKKETPKREGITIYSFGYKYKRFDGADIVLDIRDVISSAGIYWVETGRDDRVLNLARNREALVKSIVDLIIEFYIPTKKPVVVAIGCTHGRHRAVALAEVVKENLVDFPVTVIHRDLRI